MLACPTHTQERNINSLSEADKRKFTATRDHLVRLFAFRISNTYSKLVTSSAIGRIPQILSRGGRIREKMTHCCTMFVTRHEAAGYPNIVCVTVCTPVSHLPFEQQVWKIHSRYRIVCLEDVPS